MGYTVKFYIDTGCNAVNTADSLATLEGFASSIVTVSDCDIISCRNLSSFRVAKTAAQLAGADYCYVTGDNDSAVFSIEGIVPTSPDICEVYVLIDYWLTGGGTANTAYLDGIVERHHVGSNEDTFGAFCEEDPYLVPSKPLEIADAGVVLKYNGVDKTLVEASLDLGEMGDNTTGINAITYTDPNTSETVTVPKTIPLESTDRTVVSMNIPGSSPVSLATPVTAYFDASNTTAMAGLSKCRDLGCEGTILNSWTLPNDVVGGFNGNTKGMVSSISSQVRSASPTLPYEYGGSGIRNKRVYYGFHNRYVLQSVASGNKAEFNPEDIKHGSDNAPTVVAAADPRPQGKPYFRFQYFKGSDDFWVNCVPGLEWQNAPLVYYNKSGRTVDKVTFYSERANAAEIRGLEIAQTGLETALSAGSAAFNIAASGMSQKLYGYDTTVSGGIMNEKGFNKSISMGGGIMSGIGGMASGLGNLYVENQKYNIARENELRRFNISQTVVTPQLEYPREESLRDFLGNGCRVYRYRYSDSDLTKMDNILSAYGYKDTTLISPTHFTNRREYNYVKANGVTVRNTNIPKWIRDGMAAQLSAGIRIWHNTVTKPNASYYVGSGNT